MRPSHRSNDEIRKVVLEPHVNPYAEGSCFVKFGNTHVLITASVDENVPRFLKGKGKGWVTAEYSMLPRATHRRMRRESAEGKQSGRTQEIQRLIGRSLRSITDLESLGERQIYIDCDVIQADGGTRTAAITGAYVALHLACDHLVSKGLINKVPLNTQVAAISCGVYEDQTVVDLDYDEDSSAQVDANFILTENGEIIEIQATGEEHPFQEDVFLDMMALAKKAAKELTKKQREALGLEMFA